MALLSQMELADLRRNVRRSAGDVSWTKPQINAAVQAIEDWFVQNRSSLVTAINTATGPFLFTGAQKKALVGYWMKQKFGREGV